MALEAAIYHEDPLNYGFKDFNYNLDGFGLDQFVEEDKPNAENLQCWDSPPSCVAQNTDSSAGRRPKSRRKRTVKNKEEMESQRMTHIAVERNRRRQMNDYLALLRSLMPPSYAQRGDQASIVGGAINYVKELEQQLQFLQVHKLSEEKSDIFSEFFSFPQYSMRPISSVEEAAERRSTIADIEVTMAECHANIKILSKRRSKQVIKMVAGFESLCLIILHLNITTVDQSVLYCFSVKVEEQCELSTANEIAGAVHGMVGMIQQEESTSSQDNPPHQLNN